jgi:predicted nucleotidyltransferase
LERYIAQGVQGAVEQNLVSEIIDVAQREFSDGYIGLLLFGSQARGDAHDTSDTDLLLVVDESVKVDRSLYRRWDARLPERVSIQISHLPSLASDASSLWLECAMDARILHDPSNRIANFIERAKQYITSGNVVRRVTHGQGFWVPL